MHVTKSELSIHSSSLVYNKRPKNMCSLWHWYIRKTWYALSCHNPIYYSCLSNTFSTGTFPFSSLSEALPILVNYLEGFTSLFSKLPSLCDPNNLETPWSHLEILDTKYISKVVSSLKIPDFIKQILKSLKKKSLL